MSGDERRGTDGGEHPLDVDARFADIIAHFHDGEPAAPRVVDDRDDRDPAPRTSEPTDDAEGDGGDATDDWGHEDRRTVDGTYDDRRADASAVGEDRPAGEAAWPAAPVDPATDWAARYERAAREELAAHEERTARLEREARVSAEVDRAVDGPDSRYVPEEPPPLPRPADLPGRLAWGAVLLGPVALVLFALLWRSAPPWLLAGVVTAIVAGFAYLVWRLPRTHDRDDGGDGAIV